MYDGIGEALQRDREAERKLNLIQLLALSWMIGIGAGTLARIAGCGWGTTLLVAWAGAVLGALAVTALIVLADWASARLGRDAAGASEGIGTLIGAWDEDLALDRADARARMIDAGAGIAVNGRDGGSG